MKTVKKHWGEEIWLEDGTCSPYALKKILFLAGNRTSLQVHKFKIETNFVISGKGKLYYTDEFFDVDEFLQKGMSKEQVSIYEANMQILELEPGVSFSIQPGHVHRVVATTDLTFIEASSCELDDVYRLQDDQNRTHGKIQTEHDWKSK
jgi:mannose-6-phosphate isomerase-like protein (cupin superfamily)